MPPQLSRRSMPGEAVDQKGATKWNSTGTSKSRKTPSSALLWLELKVPLHPPTAQSACSTNVGNRPVLRDESQWSPVARSVPASPRLSGVEQSAAPVVPADRLQGARSDSVGVCAGSIVSRDCTVRDHSWTQMQHKRHDS